MQFRIVQNRIQDRVILSLADADLAAAENRSLKFTVVQKYLPYITMPIRNRKYQDKTPRFAHHLGGIKIAA